MNSISDPGYSEEPAGGGAESIPDPVEPAFEQQPEQASPSEPSTSDAVETEPVAPGVPVMDQPVMDGALDDMSDGGTTKAEANDMQEDGTLDQARLGDSVLDSDLAEGLQRGLDEGPVERGEVKG